MFNMNWYKRQLKIEEDLQVIRDHSKIPNAETIKTIENIEKGIGLHEVASIDELFKELNS